MTRLAIPDGGNASIFDAVRPHDGMRLVDLAREIPGAPEVTGDAEARVFGVHHDSRRVERGDLFVARKGESADGARFVGDAEARGAAAVLAAKGSGLATRLPQLLVSDVADGLAFAAAAVYGHPSFSLEVVGITGTNGKTTTTHLVRAAIDGASGARKCGLVGTVGHSFGDLRIDASHTTPEADELARVMAVMRARGATHVAMEVSSIALALGRVRAVRFRVAAFTNFTQDHLDFHGSMEAYADAKAALFTASAPGAAVVNVADPMGARFAAQVRGPLLRVSPRVEDASARGRGRVDLAPLEATFDARGIAAKVRTPQGEVEVRSRLLGRHNLENLVVALGVVCALDLDVRKAAEAIADETGAPGRLERCDGEGDDVTVLVDYAHTPDALARVLESVRGAGARTICVFGCGGDRDPKKRGPMGEAAASGADLVVLTSDNPRTENPEGIARAAEAGLVAAGLTRHPIDRLGAEARGYAVALDRRQAIAHAIAFARPGDVVVLAGKGHEDYQVVGTEKRHFDDREEAREALAARRAKARGEGS